MSRDACQHGVPTIYDCPDCADDMDADAYFAETYDLDVMLDAPREWRERSGTVKLGELL